jgi:hypothetical protein
MKQLEGEALKQLHDIGGDEAVARVENLSVKPEQFFGMELNGRAIQIAELVLWIGYIQWHMRTRTTVPPEPVIGSADHVQEKDALLRWTDYPHRHLRRDGLGRPMSDQQGNEIYAFPDVTRPEWPAADFIVGNPPFIGGKDIRGRLERAMRIDQAVTRAYGLSDDVIDDTIIHTLWISIGNGLPRSVWA